MDLVAEREESLSRNHLDHPLVSKTTTALALSESIMEVELVAEPEGGEELTASSTIADTRMKQMQEVPGAGGDDEGPVYEFWLSAVAEGDLIKQYRVNTLKEASKQANFPGFRKGQVPPYAQPQITQFAVQEAMLATIQSAISSYGLKSLQGSEGQVTVMEEVEKVCKGYNIKSCPSIPFTATFNATYDSLKVAGEETTPSAVVDVEGEEVTDTDEEQ